MRKLCVLLAMILALTGCAGTETFETVDDAVVQSVMAQPKQIQLTLPEETVLPAMETDNSTVYMCREFDVSVQTLDGGDLVKTIQTISGFSKEDLSVIETERAGLLCYEFVWSAAGELDEQVCRCMILDDGSYHYVVTAMVDADLAGEYQQMWNGMFETVAVS